MQRKSPRPEDLFKRAVESQQRADYVAALEACESILKAQPAAEAMAATYNLKALSLAGLGNIIDAVTPIRQALAIKPGDARLHIHAARLLSCLGRHRPALQHLQDASRLEPLDPEPDIRAAFIYQVIDQPDAAMSSALSSVRKHEGNLEGWMLLAELCAEQEDYPGVLECLRPALDHRPLLARAWAWLAEVEPRLQSGLPIGEKLKQARDQAHTYEDYATAVFALAHRRRREGLHAEAFKLYQQVNQSLEKARSFAIEAWETRVAGIIESSGREDIYAEPHEPDKPNTPGLVFICGMPRSGTSLCEQIVSSNPRVYGAGELPTMQYVESCLRQRGIDPYGEDASGWLDEMREVFLRSLPPAKNGEDIVIDKTPRNFERLGLILRLFPGARLLWMLRNPLDTILSCFFQDFASSQEYSSSLDHTARVYVGHMRLLRHWQQQFNDWLKVVEYSGLVLDQEATTRKLADFVGVEFDPAMLQPHLNPRIVRTSSLWQVRRPVFTSSIGKWKLYAGELGGLIRQLQACGLVDAEGHETYHLHTKDFAAELA